MITKKLRNLWIYQCIGLDRSKKAFGFNPHKAIFGIIQGGLFKDLRIRFFRAITKY